MRHMSSLLALIVCASVASCTVFRSEEPDIQTGAIELDAFDARRAAATPGGGGAGSGAAGGGAATGARASGGDLFVDPYGGSLGMGPPAQPAAPIDAPVQIESGYEPADVGLFADTAPVVPSTTETFSPPADFAGFDTVNFDTDSAELTLTAQGILDQQAAWLLANPSEVVIIEGHCDERGTRDYNMALGQRRGDSVADYLESMGVERSRLRTISYGKERPMLDALCSLPDCWAKNRRAVTVVHNTDAAVF